MVNSANIFYKEVPFEKRLTIPALKVVEEWQRSDSSHRIFNHINIIFTSVNHQGCKPLLVNLYEVETRCYTSTNHWGGVYKPHTYLTVNPDPQPRHKKEKIISVKNLGTIDDLYNDGELIQSSNFPFVWNLLDTFLYIELKHWTLFHFGKD